MSPFWAAIRFLTVLPVPASWGSRPDSLGRSAFAFPIVGLILGAFCAGMLYVANAYVGDTLSAALVVVLLAFLTGGLHLDGLADAADGLCVPRRRERALEIMRDPRTGAMGVIAIVAVLLMKVLSLADLSAGDRVWAALLMPAAGRTALVVGMAVMPYVRSSGLGTPFYERRPRISAIWSVALLGGAGWAALEMPGLIAAVSSLVVTVVLCGWVVRKLGGTTGDTLGGIAECVEVIVPLSITTVI